MRRVYSLIECSVAIDIMLFTYRLIFIRKCFCIVDEEQVTKIERPVDFDTKVVGFYVPYSFSVSGK